MPKLTENSLEKKFHCPHCGESVRTRQGLSGHIQFKHSDKHTTIKTDSDFLLSKAGHLTIWSAALPRSSAQAAGNI